MTISGEYRTPHERFWAGEFGDRYIGRNVAPEYEAANTALFSRILATRHVGSALEVGANVGMNLRALRTLLPNAELAGLEINQAAADGLRDWGQADVIEASILDWTPDRQYDLVFTKGALIHMPPDHLPHVYEKLVEASARFVLIAEYYNPVPMSIPYRGHDDRLFRRDFAGEMLDFDPRLRLVDYGFVYRRDPAFPQDDITWFLMEKSA